MNRLLDWQSRLADLLAARKGEPFSWGLNDCCTFACDCVETMTGHDPAAGLRDYRDARGAAEALAANGGVLGLGDARLGAAIAPVLAQVGDIGMATLDGRDSLVVCTGGGWVGPGPDGLVWLPSSAVAAHAWRAT